MPLSGQIVRGGHQPKIEYCPGCGSGIDTSSARPLDTRACEHCGRGVCVLREFGPYTLREKIGEGGMGAVYRAADKELVRQVALKLVIDDGSSSDAIVQRFEAEAATMASLKEEHIVQVYSTGSEQGNFYLAMEFMTGGSLQDQLDREGCIDEAHALDIAIQVATGLQAVFAAGLLHRDIKPANILFSQQHIAKITDFGLALFSSEAAARAKDEVAGTPYYLPPERVLGVAEDIRSDIFSLGATLYHAIAGRPPYEAETAHAIALKRLQSPPVSIQTFAPDISPATLLCLDRMLAKKPADRFQTYEELIQHLQFALDHLSLKKKPPQRPQKERVIIGGDEEQRLWAWSVLGVLLLAALLFGAAVLRRPIKAPPDIGKHPQHTELASKADATLCDGRFKQEFALLVASDFPAAAERFLAAAKSETTQPAKNWAATLAGISFLASGEEQKAKDAFLGIVDYSSSTAQEQDRELAAWFLDTREAFGRDLPNPAFLLLRDDRRPLDSLSSLIGGLAYLSSSDTSIGNGFELLKPFIAHPPTVEYAWIYDLHGMAERLLLRGDQLASEFTIIQTERPSAKRDAIIAEMQTAGPFFAERVATMLRGVIIPAQAANAANMAPPPKNGLRGEYFGNQLLEGQPVMTRYDGPIDFNWGIGSPAYELPINQFSIRWTGEIEPKYTECYTFSAAVDDGIRIWVDGRLVADKWDNRAMMVCQGSIPFHAKQRYSIVIEYFESVGDAVARLEWSSPSQPKELVPLEHLFPPKPGFVVPEIERHIVP